jgi:hypothetical protein
MRLAVRDALQLHALHWVARAALRVRSPLQAKNLVDRVAARLRPLGGIDEARAALEHLFPSGSCLSRALTVAAALPGAEVVIGVDGSSAARLSAHAWLEMRGVRLDTRPTRPTRPARTTSDPGVGRLELHDELARLPSRNSPSN